MQNIPFPIPLGLQPCETFPKLNIVLQQEFSNSLKRFWDLKAIFQKDIFKKSFYKIFQNILSGFFHKIFHKILELHSPQYLEIFMWPDIYRV